MPVLSKSVYTLIGHPLGHSLSPLIHARLFALQRRDAAYTLTDILPEQLDAARLHTVCGGNITIPYKQAVLPLLTRLDGKAALYRTVNCFAVTPQGITGCNTDADGFLQALRHAGLALHGRVLLLGCGGVGTVFACEAALAGCALTLCNPRSRARADALAAQVRVVAPHTACTVAETLPDSDFDLLINATPVGMYPHIDEAPADEALLSRCGAVFDAVYNPHETLLLRRAKACGCRTLGGMSMLVWQAALAHTYWYGASFADEDIAALTDECYTALARLAPEQESKR